jgi:pSer/pThr/pTyr-binding forkhead associated (FHA) protein
MPYAKSEATSQLARGGLDRQLNSGPIIQPGPGTAVAKLVVIRPDGTEGATIPLRDGRVTIGRNSEHQVLAADPFLSPVHASITVGTSGFTIEDEDSLNGIFYRIRGEVELQHGDLIRMGQELLLFELMSRVESVIPARVGDDGTLRSGSPDKGLWGRLSLISGPDVVTRGFAFSEDEITIGREIGDILFRDDGFVSGRHARLTKLGDRIVLKDLGSSNGTYVRIRSARQLQDGDLVLMGQQLFRLVA